MTDLLLRNGMILIAGNGKGLSAACDCCEEPPPPENCDACCFGTASGDIEVGDSVLVDIQANLPALRWQAASPQPGDNGVRRYAAVNISGQGTLDVSAVNVYTEKGRIICLNAYGLSNFLFSDVTSGEVYSLTIERGLADPCLFGFGAVIQAQSELTDIQEIIDLGEEATVPYSTDLLGSTIYYALWGLGVSLSLVSDPCSGGFQFPLYLRQANAGFSYPAIEIIGAQIGDEIGRITILGVG